jgi:hypothetical protein
MPSRRHNQPKPGSRTTSSTRHEPYETRIPSPEVESDYPHSRLQTASKTPAVHSRVSADQTRHHTSRSGYRSDSNNLTSTAPASASSYHSIPSTGRHASRSAVATDYDPAASQPSSSSLGHHAQSRSHSQKARQPYYDPRHDLSNKYATAMPSSYLSAEKVFNIEDNSMRFQQPPRSVGVRDAAARSSPEIWIPPEKAPSILRKNKHEERDKEDYRSKAKEKSTMPTENEHDGNVHNQERAREKEKRRERRREYERDSVVHVESKATSKPPASTRYYYVQPKADDADSSDSALKNPVAVSSSRRHRRNEEVVTTSLTVSLMYIPEKFTFILLLAGSRARFAGDKASIFCYPAKSRLFLNSASLSQFKRLRLIPLCLSCSSASYQFHKPGNFAHSVEYR